MVFSRTWNTAYEALPTDENFGYEIDDFIKQNRIDVRERMEIDHVWKVGETDGRHKSLTLGSDAEGDLYYRNATGLARLPKGAIGQVLCQNSGLTAPEWKYRPLENLLPNTQWIAMSGSTLENVGSDLGTNGGFSSDTTGWSGQDCTLASVAGGQSGNCLEITRTGGAAQYAWQNVTLTVGKLYKATAYVKSGTSGNETCQIGIHPANLSGAATFFTTGTSSGDWVQLSLVFEADATTMSVAVAKLTSTAGTMLFDTVTLYEVTPGYVATDTAAPDGWKKSTSLDLWREHQGTNTKDGSFYSIKSTTGAVDQYVYWPVTYDAPAHINLFKGRTVTMGVWVKTSVASHVRLGIADGVITTYSAYHTGGGGWEWLEVSKTVSASATLFMAQVGFDLSGQTAYHSQPMLAFGSSIGEGNYQPIQNEVIWLQNYFYLVSVYAPASGTTALNIETLSNGKIGKGIKALSCDLAGKNNAANKYLLIRSAAGLAISLYSQVANVNISNKGFFKTTEAGDCEIVAEDANWTAVYVIVDGLQT